MGGQECGASPAGAWSAMARREILQHAQRLEDFTADDVLARIGRPPVFRQAGAAFSAASRMGLIEPVGALVTADGRLLRLWRGCAR